jgi:hypothetical protein
MQSENPYKTSLASIMAMSHLMAESQAEQSRRTFSDAPNEALGDLAITMTARRRLAKAGNKNPSKRDIFMMVQQIRDERGEQP